MQTLSFSASFLFTSSAGNLYHYRVSIDHLTHLPTLVTSHFIKSHHHTNSSLCLPHTLTILLTPILPILFRCLKSQATTIHHNTAMDKCQHHRQRSLTAPLRPVSPHTSHQQHLAIMPVVRVITTLQAGLPASTSSTTWATE